MSDSLSQPAAPETSGWLRQPSADHFLIEIQTECLLPSCRVAISSQVPAENRESLVLRLKCQSVLVNRKLFPSVAASVGVASIAVSALLSLPYLTACSVWIPVISAAPPFRQVAPNFTGMVLPRLNVLTGSLKLPPLPVSTDPPIGEYKPLNANAL